MTAAVMLSAVLAGVLYTVETVNAQAPGGTPTAPSPGGNMTGGNATAGGNMTAGNATK